MICSRGLRVPVFSFFFYGYSIKTKEFHSYGFWYMYIQYTPSICCKWIKKTVYTGNCRMLKTHYIIINIIVYQCIIVSYLFTILFFRLRLKNHREQNIEYLRSTGFHGRKFEMSVYKLHIISNATNSKIHKKKKKKIFRPPIHTVNDKALWISSYAYIYIMCTGKTRTRRRRRADSLIIGIDQCHVTDSSRWRTCRRTRAPARPVKGGSVVDRRQCQCRLRSTIDHRRDSGYTYTRILYCCIYIWSWSYIYICKYIPCTCIKLEYNGYVNW